MTREQAREQFSAAYDGELAPDERKAFERALAQESALAAEYRAFTAMLDAARLDVAREERVPDLLSGVQKRLRVRSRGRFYSDKFAERVGVGLMNPFTITVLMVVLASLLWLAFGYLQSVDLRQ